MEEIIKILMRRDKITRREAEETLKDVRQMMDDAEDITEKEDIFVEELGLEPDYIIPFLLGE